MLRDYLALPRLVHVLCLGSLVNRAGSFVIVFLAIYASERLDFGVPFATACIGVLGLGSMFGSLAGGYLADRIGRRIVMLTSLFGGAGALTLLSFVTDRWSFMAMVGCFAMVTDLFRPAAAAMIADVVTPDRRSHAFALQYISVNLGFAIAPPVGGLLAEYSFGALFWIDAATMVASGLIVLTFITETRPPLRRTEIESNHESERSGSWVDVITDVPFLLFCASTFLIELVFVQGFSTLPIYVRQIGFEKFHFGMLMSVNGLMIVVLQLPATHSLSRFNPLSVVLVGGCFIALGFGIISLSTSMIFLAFAIMIWTLGEILQAPFKQAIVAELSPESLRGRYLGVFGLTFAAALTLGAPLGGEVLDRWGALALWTSTGLTGCFAVAIYAAVHRPVSRRLRRDRVPTPPDCEAVLAVDAA